MATKTTSKTEVKRKRRFLKTREEDETLDLLQNPPAMGATPAPQGAATPSQPPQMQSAAQPGESIFRSLFSQALGIPSVGSLTDSMGIPSRPEVASNVLSQVAPPQQSAPPQQAEIGPPAPLPQGMEYDAPKQVNPLLGFILGAKAPGYLQQLGQANEQRWLNTPGTAGYERLTFPRLQQQQAELAQTKAQTGNIESQVKERSQQLARQTEEFNAWKEQYATQKGQQRAAATSRAGALGVNQSFNTPQEAYMAMALSSGQLPLSDALQGVARDTSIQGSPELYASTMPRTAAQQADLPAAQWSLSGRAGMDEMGLRRQEMQQRSEDSERNYAGIRGQFMSQLLDKGLDAKQTTALASYWDNYMQTGSSLVRGPATREAAFDALSQLAHESAKARDMGALNAAYTATSKEVDLIIDALRAAKDQGGDTATLVNKRDDLFRRLKDISSAMGEVSSRISFVAEKEAAGAKKEAKRAADENKKAVAARKKEADAEKKKKRTQEEKLKAQQPSPIVSRSRQSFSYR